MAIKERGERRAFVPSLRCRATLAATALVLTSGACGSGEVAKSVQVTMDSKDINAPDYSPLLYGDELGDTSSIDFLTALPDGAQLTAECHEKADDTGQLLVGVTFGADDYELPVNLGDGRPLYVRAEDVSDIRVTDELGKCEPVS